MSSASSTPANEATSPPKSTKPPNKWTLEEDNLLQQAMILQDGENINWHEVAACVPGRNNKDCRKRWVYNLSLKPKKGRWSKDEDARLLNAAQNLQYRWAEVAKVVGGRQPDQCSRRWHETVNPNISHERWSLLEDETLLLAVQMHGRKWTEIVERYFYNRTPIAAKNRFEQVKSCESEVNSDTNTPANGEKGE